MDQSVTDRRVWLPTDRPGESIAVDRPLPSILLLSARGSDRCWAEYHVDYRLCLVGRFEERAGAEYRCRGGHTAVSGDLMAFEPGDHHVTTRVYGKAAFDVIGVEPTELERAADACGLRGGIHFKAAHLTNSEVAAPLQRFVACAAQGQSRLELECAQANLLQAIVQSCTERQPQLRRPDPVRHAGVRAAREYLREHFREEPRLDDLAKLAGLSRFAFAHAFKQHTGVPPYVYFQLRRASEAQRLIRQGMAIRNVAETLGYADVPHLTRMLKARLGVPPARFRACLETNRVLRE